jgi:hypothetical protein
LPLSFSIPTVRNNREMVADTELGFRGARPDGKRSNC